MNNLQVELDKLVPVPKGNNISETLANMYPNLIEDFKLDETKLILDGANMDCEVRLVHDYIEVKEYGYLRKIKNIMRCNMEGNPDSPNIEGKLLPAFVVYYDNGKTEIMIYYSKGKVGRDDGEPAMIKYNYNNHSSPLGRGGEEDCGADAYAKIWLKNGNFYERPNGEPNHVIKMSSGITIEKWCKPMNPKYDDGILNTEFNSTCILKGEVGLHRPLNKGPALIEKDLDGSIRNQEYHLNGIFIAKY